MNHRPTKEFHFINITNTSKLDEHDRDTVRTESIKSYHRKKRSINASHGGSNHRAANTPGLTIRMKMRVDGELQPTVTQPTPDYVSLKIL